MRKLVLLLNLVLCLMASNCWSAVTFTTTGTDVLSCGTNDDILTENGAMTVSVWVNLAQDTANGGDPKIWIRDDNSNGFIFLGVSTTKKLYFDVHGTTSLTHFSANNSWVANTWTNVIVTWDGSVTAANSHIYVNGTEVSYASAANGVSLSNDSASTFFIGNEFDGLRPAAGKVDELAVWSTVLSATDIASVSGQRAITASSAPIKGLPLFVSPTTLKRYFALDECPSGSTCNVTFRDKSPTAVNCTGTNSPTGASNTTINYPEGIE